MSKDAKNVIEKLKGMVLAFHRTAGHLDKIIQEMEDAELDSECFPLYVRAQMMYREDMKKQNNYENLDKMEKHIWDELIESVKIET